MNQKKIGAFIAECRKRKNMTQFELAEKLDVTDRSVSNWENGVCLPDASLYQFHNSLKIISEVSLLLKRFEDKQEAVQYLVKETGLPEEECSSAYDIYAKMFQ